LGDLERQRQARIEERQDDTANLQSWIELALDELRGVRERTKAFERVVLALDGDQHVLSGHQRVHREQAQGGWAVDDDVVVRDAQRLERVKQPAFAARKVDQLDLGAREGAVRGKDVEAGDRGGPDDLVDVVGVDDDVVDTTAELAAGDAESAGGVALRVHVDDQPAQAELRKVGSHVDGGRRLTDSALLVDDCVDSWQFAGWTQDGAARIIRSAVANARLHKWNACA